MRTEGATNRTTRILDALYDDPHAIQNVFMEEVFDGDPNFDIERTNKSTLSITWKGQTFVVAVIEAT